MPLTDEIIFNKLLEGEFYIATTHKSCFYIKMSKTIQKTKWHERYLLINKAWVNNFLKNVYYSPAAIILHLLLNNESISEG